jgi:hypothetical protein
MPANSRSSKVAFAFLMSSFFMFACSLYRND